MRMQVHAHERVHEGTCVVVMPTVLTSASTSSFSNVHMLLDVVVGGSSQHDDTDAVNVRGAQRMALIGRT